MFKIWRHYPMKFKILMFHLHEIHIIGKIIIIIIRGKLDYPVTKNTNIFASSNKKTLIFTHKTTTLPRQIEKGQHKNTHTHTQKTYLGAVQSKPWFKIPTPHSKKAPIFHPQTLALLCLSPIKKSQLKTLKGGKKKKKILIPSHLKVKPRVLKNNNK